VTWRLALPHSPPYAPSFSPSLSRGEAGAEVEHPGGIVPREEDAVAADLAGAAEDGNVELSWHFR